jgi:hypothetical protein
MFFLGILAFLQITCLPGILLIKACKLKGSLIQIVVSTFGISLVANYVIVLLLTTLGIYLQIENRWLSNLDNEHKEMPGNRLNPGFDRITLSKPMEDFGIC